MSNALAVYDGGRFDVMQRASRALLESGYFSDTKSLAQVVVKVMAGAELGISPFASVSGIHIIQGKPALSSNLIATLVKNDPRYNYRVTQATDAECILTWYEDGEEVGTSSFTMKEAQAAGLTGKSTWKQYPSDMLFARALTRGARRHAPGIFGGAPVYTADELGADEAPDGYVEPSQIPTIVVHQAEPEPTDNGNGPDTINGNQLKALHIAGRTVYGDEWDDKRGALVEAVTKGRATSSKELTEAEWRKLLDGIQARADREA